MLRVAYNFPGRQCGSALNRDKLTSATTGAHETCVPFPPMIPISDRALRSNFAWIAQSLHLCMIHTKNRDLDERGRFQQQDNT